MKGVWFDRLLGLLLVVGIVFSVWKYNFQKPDLIPQAQKSTDVPAVMEPTEPFSHDDMERFQKIKLMHVTGDYPGALKFAQDLLQNSTIEPPFREWLTKQIGPLMAAAGWLKLRTGECDEALKLFYKAVRVSPTPEAKKGLGVCLHAAKQWPEAATWLAAYMFDAPSDMDARLIYSDALESLGRFDEAVTVLEGAAANTELPQDKKDVVQTRLQAMKVKAREGTSQKSEFSRRFFVRFREEVHEPLLPGIFETLESALDEFSELLGVLPNEGATEVVLYRQEAFHDVIPGGPEWSEGVFDGRIRVPLSPAMMKDPKGLLSTVLRHELSHALVSQKSNGRSVPTWFDEGLAQYLACRGRSCSALLFPATPGRFSDVSFLSEPFVTLSSIDAGRAYFHSLYIVRVVVKDQSEDVLKRWGEIPAQGAMSSDHLASVFGYKEFADLVRQARVYYDGRSSL